MATRTRSAADLGPAPGAFAQRRPCRLEAAPLRGVDPWVRRFRELREASFDAFDGVLEDLKQQDRRKAKRREEMP